MAINELDFGENTWLNSQLYPPVVTDESQVRGMLQSLHNVVRDYINTVLVPAINAPAHHFFYEGMPPADGALTFTKGGTHSWYLDLPGLGRLYANTSGAVSVRHYATHYNPSTGETTVEKVIVEAEIWLKDGAFDRGTITFTAGFTGELATLTLSAEATQSSAGPMLTEMASLSEDAALTLVRVGG